MHQTHGDRGFALDPTGVLTAPSDNRGFTALSLKTHPGSAIQVSSSPYPRNVDFVLMPLANITCSQTVCTNRSFSFLEKQLMTKSLCVTRAQDFVYIRFKEWFIEGIISSHTKHQDWDQHQRTTTLLVPTASSWHSLWHFHQETRPISIQKIHASPPPHLHQFLIYRSISRTQHGMLYLATHSPISPYSVGLYADLPQCRLGKCTGRTGETHGRRESRCILAAGLHTSTPDTGTSSVLVNRC